MLYNTDIGQALHRGGQHYRAAGGNYGWPFREGTFVTDRNDETKLYALPENDATNGYTYPVAQYDHSEGFTSSGQPVVKGSIAITGGFVYRTTGIPALVGHYIFGDMVNGRIFHVPVSELRLGSQTTIKELTLTRNGVAKTLNRSSARPGGWTCASA